MEHPTARPFDGECCADMVQTKERLNTLEKDSVDFKEFIKEMREAITYRLPLWATFALSALSAAVGWLIASR